MKDFFNFKTKRGVIELTFVVILLVLFVNISLGFYLISNKPSTNPHKTISLETKSKDSFTYRGEEGKDAFSLLQNKTSVEVDTSGLVVSINGRKADQKKREFWSFYVNDVMASVGPKDYIAKSSDEIEWRIETY
jgi:hypothetical protein